LKIRNVILFLLLFACAERFCHFQTRGFRLPHILSQMPPDSRWDLPPSPEQASLSSLVRQRFTFLGSGGQCYAFLGEDKTTVLKFFKHTHPLSSIFESCKLAWDELREETGLIALHLNRTSDLYGWTTLIDNIGIAHRIDLDSTEFILQKKGEPLFEALQRAIDARDTQTALRCIEGTIDLLSLFCQRGIADTDRAIKRNFALLNGRIIAIDIGSFMRDHSMREKRKTELLLKTRRLERWLKKHAPDLTQHYVDKISASD
jgi:hypothetical protein